MSETGIQRMLQSKEVPTVVLDHLKPHLNETRSLQMTLILLLIFTLSVLVLAACFKVLQHFMDEPVYAGGGDEPNVPLSTKVKTKVRKLVGGRSDIELQRLLQSSSSVPGLIFTLVGLVAVYATNGALARLLMGLVGLGSQVVFLTWIYVESWGEFTNSFILTGTLITAAYGTLSPAMCPSLACLTREHSWEPTLIRSTFYFMLATSALHVFLAAAALLGILRLHPDVLMNRLYKVLDDHLSHTVDIKVFESSLEESGSVSKSSLSELVEWCMDEKYLGEMKERVYRGLWRTKLRVALTAIPTLVLAASAIYVKSSGRWSGAAAVSLLVASCSAILLGFLCAKQREHRLPLCFSRGIDIIESFENATSDLLGMERDDYEEKVIAAPTQLFEQNELKWKTCNYMVIQTLGLAELGHFEHQQARWEDESESKDGKISVKYVDPNSNVALMEMEDFPENVQGLKKRRERIVMAILDRDPVKIGPTAVSKIAGVMLAMHNAIQYMSIPESGHYPV